MSHNKCWFWVWTSSLSPQRVQGSDRLDAVRRFVADHAEAVRWSDGIHVVEADEVHEYRLTLQAGLTR